MADLMDIARKHLAAQKHTPTKGVSEGKGAQGGGMLKDVLKGTAICLYSDLTGDHIWIVADEQDAATLAEPRGCTYTADEVRMVCRIDDTATVAELHRWKREFNGALHGLRGKRG